MDSLSSMKTLPFFFPRVGFTTPAGVIMFSVGRLSSLSEYTRCFFLEGREVEREAAVGFVFTCFVGRWTLDLDMVEGPAVADLRALGFLFRTLVDVLEVGGLGAMLACYLSDRICSSKMGTCKVTLLIRQAKGSKSLFGALFAKNIKPGLCRQNAHRNFIVPKGKIGEELEST